MDIVDPFRIRYMGGKWYVLVIIDDYSRYSWVFFLKSKDEVFDLEANTIVRSYRVLNLETNTVVESCDLTFDETAPCPRDVFKCAGDKEMEESIFADEELQGFDGDKDEPLLSSTSSPELFPASTLEVEAPQATTASTTSVEASWFEGDINSEQGAPSHFRRHIHINRS
jgi:hypothetical protein